MRDWTKWSVRYRHMHVCKYRCSSGFAARPLHLILNQQLPGCACDCDDEGGDAGSQSRGRARRRTRIDTHASHASSVRPQTELGGRSLPGLPNCCSCFRSVDALNGAMGVIWSREKERERMDTRHFLSLFLLADGEGGRREQTAQM